MRAVAAATVTCTSAQCTASAGEVGIRIFLGDGSVADSQGGWGGPGG